MPNEYEQTINDHIKQSSKLEREKSELRKHADRLAGALKLLMDKVPSTSLPINVRNKAFDAWADYRKFTGEW